MPIAARVGQYGARAAEREYDRATGAAVQFARLQQRLGRLLGSERGHGLEVTAEAACGLLAAQRRADEHARRVRQALVQPLGHALRLAFALRGQRALEIVLVGTRGRRLGMSPQDQLHHPIDLYRAIRPACAEGPSVSMRR